MAAVSIFDIFKIGIGPSSSHTVGPMKAAREFAMLLDTVADKVATVEVTLYGSLAFTGKGHGTDSAVILGLMGMQPDTIDPDAVEGLLRKVHAQNEIDIPAVGVIEFDPQRHLRFEYGEELPRHTNGMRFKARSDSGELLFDEKYYSLGGGFIAHNDEPEAPAQKGAPVYFFDSGNSLLIIFYSVRA